MKRCFVLLAVVALSACATKPPLKTVAAVDLKRYAGTWHEVARYPNLFQRNCAGDVTAQYTPQPDGSIQVVNSCRKKNGAYETITGRATVVPGTGNAQLKVSFAGPFKGDYWIIGLANDYSWAIVGHPSRRYLWILSRSAEVSPELYLEIVAQAALKGYEPLKIQRTP